MLSVDSNSHMEASVPMEDVCVYKCNMTDVRGGMIKVDACKYTISWAEDDDVPQEIREASHNGFHALATKGDGACAIHAVFGKPDSLQELFCNDARQYAINFLSRLPDAARADAMASSALKIIRTSFWHEFAKPKLNGNGSPESEMFWKALQTNAPDLVAEAERHVNEYRVHVSASQQTITNAVTISRESFFRQELEMRLIRPLAKLLGYLPSDVLIDCDENGVPRTVVVRNEDRNTYEGCATACDDLGFVKGTQRIPFPVDGPDCKYCALFDARPMFDPLRQTFLTFNDQASKPSSLLIFLESPDFLGAPVGFISALRAWHDLHNINEEPEQFGVRAWNAYLMCVRNEAYFFSVDELTAICQQAGVRVFIFKHIEDSLVYAGGNPHVQGISI